MSKTLLADIKRCAKEIQESFGHNYYDSYEWESIKRRANKKLATAAFNQYAQSSKLYFRLKQTYRDCLKEFHNALDKVAKERRPFYLDEISEFSIDYNIWKEKCLVIENKVEMRDLAAVLHAINDKFEDSDGDLAYEDKTKRQLISLLFDLYRVIEHGDYTKDYDNEAKQLDILLQIELLKERKKQILGKYCDNKQPILAPAQPDKKAKGVLRQPS